jgi:pimeloyl-ACP methyl ester carboxylesterase
LVLLLSLSSLIFLSGCDPYLENGEPTAGRAYKIFFPSSADGLMIPCTIYLPKNYDPNKTYPMWVELHALNGIPVLDNNDMLPLSVTLRSLSDQYGWICLAPWGRNMHSLYMDGLKREGAPYYEPNLFEDFSNGAGSWKPLNGSWSVTGGAYRQTSTSQSWKESVFTTSTGKDYCVRVKVKDLSSSGVKSGFAVNLRRNATAGNAYRIEFWRDASNKKSIRLVKLAGGVETQMFTADQDWAPPYGDDRIDVRFSCYNNYLELSINSDSVNLHENPIDYDVYGFGKDVPGDPIPAGTVSLCSYGGVHEFDEVRVQNDYEYGERDAFDCIYGAMEKYKIDPKRIYLMGHSQGGSGSWIMSMHRPDFFAAFRAADGFTDIYYDYTWFVDHYPRNPGPPYVEISDGRMAEYIENVAGGPISPSTPDRMSILNGSSARYILENAINNNCRINHGTPDNNVPNSHEPVVIEWMVPFFFWHDLEPAPPPYSPATPTYANGKDIYDILSAWSAISNYNCTYVTDPNIGHGFLEPGTDTAAYFQSKTANRRPSEVAYKTYDNVNTGAWWLRLQIPHPGTNEPGLARVKADAAQNKAAIHARNLTRLKLDLDWMGLNNGAGKTMSFTLDDNTEPHVFLIDDTTKKVTLELVAEWTATSGYVVKFDGVTLNPGSDYTIEGNSLVIKDLSTVGGHTLTVQSPASLPANLAPNPGAETANANWTGEVQNGGSATFAWDDLEAHGGSRSLRIKGGTLSAANSRPVWKSDKVTVSAGNQYLLSAFNKARMFRGGDIGIGVIWYNSLGNVIRTDWVDAPGGSDYALVRDWVPVSAKLTAPSGSVRAAVIAGYEANAAGQAQGSVWFDDFSFTEL